MPSPGSYGFTVVPGDGGEPFLLEPGSLTPTPGGSVIWLPVGTAGRTIAPGTVVMVANPARFCTVVGAAASGAALRFAFIFTVVGDDLCAVVAVVVCSAAGAAAFLSFEPPQ